MDEKRSAVPHILVLRRVEAERNVARFYALMIEHDQFGRTVLIRNGSRMSRRGRE